MGWLPTYTAANGLLFFYSFFCWCNFLEAISICRITVPFKNANTVLGYCVHRQDTYWSEKNVKNEPTKREDVTGVHEGETATTGRSVTVD